jgi:predicted MFS family arabinose efflux permease
MMRQRSAVLFLIYSALFHIGVLGIVDVVLNFYFVSLGNDPETIGLLQSVPRLSGLLLSIPLGLLTDRIGKHRMMMIATVGCALSMWVLLIPTLPMLALSRFLLGMSYSAQQLVVAPLMLTLIAPQNRTRYFSLYNLITMIAMAFGSFIGGSLPSLLVSAGTGIVPPEWTTSAETPFAYGAALFLTGLIALIGLLPLWWIRPQRESAVSISFSGIASRSIPWRTLAYISLPMLTFGFSGGLTFPFYNLFFRTVFGLSDAAVGSILSLGWISMALIPLLSSTIEKRIGRISTLGISMCLAALAFVGLGALPRLEISVLLFLFAIGFRNIMQPLFQPLVLESVTADLHNVTSGMGMILWNIGWFGAAASGGFLQTSIGFGLIMQIVAISVLITGIMVVAIFRRGAVDLLMQQRVKT